MHDAPRLTDRKTLLAHRARAARAGDDGLFLHRIAAVEAQERLDEVNRRFTDVAVVAGLPAVWAEAFPAARVVADDDVLDLAEGSLDLVVHAMALHWADDPVGQLVQCRRALRPDGLFIGVLFGAQTLAELRAALAEAEARVAGGLSPRVAPMGEVRDLGALLQRAGFALPVADSALHTVTYRDALALMRDLRSMGETNALAARDRRIPPRALFPAASEIYAASFPAEDGRVRASFELVWLTGWAPSETQQKPLRPGSAQARLADALGTSERPTGDTTRPGSD